MPKFFSRILNFFRDYPGILYSFFLIVFIPLALYYNTAFTVESLQKNIDSSLYSKASMAEDIFSVFAVDFFSDTEALQQKVEEITRLNPEIKDLRIMTEAKGGDFNIIASQNVQEVEGIISNPPLALSWSQNQVFVDLVSDNEERFWKVIKPIYNNETEEKIGLISLSLSLKQADELIASSIYRSYLIVLAVIVLSLSLIIQHTRLFGYVSLSKRLQEVDKMKDSFIRMATHELQSPITNVRAYVEVLEEEIQGSLDKKQKEYLKRIKISAKNLSILISDILEVSRIEQGRLDFTSRKLSPIKVIEETVAELKIKAEQKKLKLVFKGKEEPYLINVNLNRFKQIIVNLIVNSIKYTPKGKIEITAEANKKRGKYIISVSDSGLGISAEAQKQLFEKFYRVKTKETADVPGTGLGLWVTKQLCEKMKGEIFVESMEGAGSKFTISFPLIKASQKNEKTKES